MKRIFYLFFLSLPFGILQAQDSSLLKMLDDSMSMHAKPLYVTGTFKATHIVNMQTVEAPAEGALNFVIQHRFGRLNSGSYNFFGLDGATLRLRASTMASRTGLTVGVGRSSFLKTYDGYLKYKLLRQTDGNDKMPVTVSLLGTINILTLDSLYKSESYLNSPDMYQDKPPIRPSC